MIAEMSNLPVRSRAGDWPAEELLHRVQKHKFGGSVEKTYSAMADLVT